MIDEDEDDNSYVAMALHFGVRLFYNVPIVTTAHPPWVGTV
jgi:hypothetical protein